MTQTAYPGYPPPTPPPTPPTPQYPVQPSYPVAPGQLPGYGYPPQQQYAPQFPPQQPAQPLAQGSIDDYFNQPSTGGGKSLSFQGKPPGTRYVGIVTRPVTQADIQQQTDTTQRPQFYRDGRPKFVMKVPLQMQPSPEYPDGLAQWFVKGQARDELVRAMAEAGAPAGPPEANAIIDITFTGTRPSGPGLNPANQFRIGYQRPNGAAPAPQPAPAEQPQYQPAPEQAAPQPQYPATTAPAATVTYQQPPVPAPQPSAPPAAQTPQPPADLSAEQQALLARLTGAQPSG